MAIKPTHSGKPNQSCLKKPIRTILKKQQTEAIGAIQKAFKGRNTFAISTIDLFKIFDYTYIILVSKSKR